MILEYKEEFFNDLKITRLGELAASKMLSTFKGYTFPFEPSFVWAESFVKSLHLQWRPYFSYVLRKINFICGAKMILNSFNILCFLPGKIEFFIVVAILDGLESLKKCSERKKVLPWFKEISVTRIIKLLIRDYEFKAKD